MSTKTRTEVLAELKKKYVHAGAQYRICLINQAVELLGYHRKAAIRALNAKFSEKPAPAVRTGRPKEYHPDTLLVVLKPIWFAAQQPCGSRLVAMLPDWLPAYEADHRRLDADVREALLRASARTLDRLLKPLRVGLARRSATRPGSLLRQSIPIRGPWTEQGPGWLEMDTVAMCGGRLDDLHAWMLDTVDIRTDWIELRALANRSQHSTLEQICDIEKSLPFALLGADSDNGGEFINHHLVRYFSQREKPVIFTRSRPYHKNDNAHVEQRNYTHVREHFGYERYDNPSVVPLINALCKGALRIMHNHFLCSHKLQKKRRDAHKTTRIYGPAQSAYSRVMGTAEVDKSTKTRLQAEHAAHNPFELRREIEKQKKRIEAERLLRA